MVMETQRRTWKDPSRENIWLYLQHCNFDEDNLEGLLKTLKLINCPCNLLGAAG